MNGVLLPKLRPEQQEDVSVADYLGLESLTWQSPGERGTNENTYALILKFSQKAVTSNPSQQSDSGRLKFTETQDRKKSWI